MVVVLFVVFAQRLLRNTMRSAVLGVLLLLVAVATAQTLFAPHRPDLYRGEIGTGFSGDALILTFTEETIYSLPFDVPQGIGEEFGKSNMKHTHLFLVLAGHGCSISLYR